MVIAKSLYIGCEYLLLADDYFDSKYGHDPLNFIPENTVDFVLGNDWRESQQPIVKEFRRRMFWKGLKIYSIAEPIIYGKVKELRSPFPISELVLLSEIALNKSIDEVEKLTKLNKIKLQKL